MADPREDRLPELARWCILLVFGAVTTLAILANGEPGVRRGVLLLFSAGLGSIAAALAWFLAVAVQRSLIWTLVLALPVVNALVLPIFVRLYWTRGTRFPAMLALAGMVGEIVGGLLLMGGVAPVLV